MNQQIQNPLLEAQPETIEVVETYLYQTMIGTNSGCVLVPGETNPTGMVQVKVPYDGHKYLPVKSALSLQSDLTEFSADTPHQAVVGWLGISQPYDVLSGRRENDGLEFIEPVKLTLRHAQLLAPEDWVSDRFVCINEHSYTPAKPRYFPVNIAMKIWDSKSDLPIYYRMAIDAAAKAETNSEMIQLLSGEMLQGGAFVMDLDIDGILPADVDPKSIRIKLSKLGLNWQVVPQSGDLDVIDWSEARDIGWRYNPDNSTVEISDINMVPQAASTGSNLRPYRASLSFVVKQASQIILRSEMEGVLVIEVGGLLLSGRQAAWMDVTGKRVNEPVEIQMKTMLSDTFQINLNDLFMNRQAVAYRQWVLPGVPLTPTRLNELSGALSDLGYEISADNKSFGNLVAGGGAEKPVFGRVTGYRWEIQKDQEPVRVDIEIWAAQVAPSQTEHEVTGSQGTVRTTLTTSDLFISAFGRSSCQGSVLANDLDSLMVILKSRLMAIATRR